MGNENNSIDNNYLYACCIYYITIFSIIASFLILLYTHGNFSFTTITSGQYLVSTIIQFQAAIFALVISISIIGIQYVASSYSPHILRLFEKNYVFWSFVSIYAISITYGIILLKYLDGTKEGYLFPIIEPYLVFFCCLAIFSIFAIFPYFWYTIQMLKLENVINFLVNDIIQNKRLCWENISSIFDVTISAISHNDSKACRVGLLKIHEISLKYFPKIASSLFQVGKSKLSFPQRK